MRIHLSPRARQVLACLAHGQTDREISEALGISVHTVHTYVRRLYAETGITKRAALVAWYLSHDLGIRSPSPTDQPAYPPKLRSSGRRRNRRR